MVMVPRSIPIPPDGVRDIEIIASDGVPLAARLFTPARAALGTLVIHGATATPQRYYHHFAEYAAERGWRVVTYDYRGVGASRPRSLRGFQATMREWADKDAAAILAWIDAAFPGRRVSVGHSFGGQLLGILDRAAEVERAVLVGAQVGYVGHWSPLERLRLRFLWGGAVPVLTAAFGYLPGRAGLGEDLPSGVAREWARWCSSPGYLFDHVDGAAERMARFSAPTLLLSATDDEFAPAAAVDDLIGRMTGAPLAHRRVSPEELGVERLGHFGFFRRQHRESLWREAVDFLDTGATRTRAAVATRGSWSLSTAEVIADLDYGR